MKNAPKFRNIALGIVAFPCIVCVILGLLVMPPKIIAGISGLERYETEIFVAWLIAAIAAASGWLYLTDKKR
ncbi:MAG: hypothetical protein OXR03_21340 [Rhodospirillaceae bacterium]|nr:hypothetical protein [Rhodospirillaceae bacterium]